MNHVSPRPATLDDVAGITALYRRWETRWHGAPEHDADEVAEELGTVELATHSALVELEGRAVGLGWWRGYDSALLVDPDLVTGADVRDALLDWFDTARSPALTHLEADTATGAAIRDRGWRHVRSSFELLRPVSDEWPPAPPPFPADVGLRALQPDDLPAVHRLVYEDARWSDVPGHVHRDYDEWRSLIVNEAALAHPQLLLTRGDRVIGVALGRVFSDGTGWIAQLAVAADERGHGFGRSLLLAALRARADEGATQLGLAVEAENRAALRLYLDAGLKVDREWQTFEK
ncbi:GNAT family N-acetyltransferase [Jatrophihabitans fulvus]